MSAKAFRDRLQRGETLLGILQHYPCVAILETIGCDWDFVWIDAQHGQFSYESTLDAVRVADLLGLETLLRIESRDPDLLGKYADLGSSALMIPMVDTPEDAEAIVRALRFPPRGFRSFGSRRLADCVGLDYHQAVQPLIFAQIETPEAIENAPQIAAVDGVDVLYFSPDDLKIRMQIPIETATSDSETLLSAMEKIADAAKQSRKALGAAGVTTPELLGRCIDMGYQVVTGGSDVMFIRRGSARQLELLRPVADR